MADLAELNRRYGIPGLLSFDAGRGGLARAVVTAAGAEGHIYLHGAHVTHYQRRGEPALLFLSAKSAFEDGKPIRGGVPVCFPWFGARAGHPEAPGHGFARLREWVVESADRAGNDTLTLTLLLRDDERTRAAWPHAFELRHRVTIGPGLTMSLEVRNTGTAEALTFEEALHSYFAISDIGRARVTGLEGADFINKAPAGRGTQEGPIIVTAEADRVYVGTRATCTLDDPGLKRRVRVAKTGSEVTVVWNPWVSKAKAMPDFGADEWHGMICIETANTGDYAVKLGPGERHTMTAKIDL